MDRSRVRRIGDASRGRGSPGHDAGRAQEPTQALASAGPITADARAWRSTALAAEAKKGGCIIDDKSRAKSALLFALSRIAKLGDKAQELAIDAMHSFDEYQLAEPRPRVLRPEQRSVCLHCGKPYEEVES